MINKVVGEIYKLTDDGIDLFVVVNFDLDFYDVKDYNKDKTPRQFKEEAKKYGESLLETYQNDAKTK